MCDIFCLSFCLRTDPSEIPLCDMSFSCDNLLCDASGRPPNAVLVVHVYFPSERVWVRYGRTEVVEVSITLASLLLGG